MARHAQITQNNKFCISLQYLKKQMSDEVDLFHGYKYESFLQINTMIFMGMTKHSPNSQNSKFAMFLQYLKKVDRDEVDILHADKHQHFGQQSFLQVDAIIIDGHDKHVQHTQSNKFTNISKKMLGMEFIFCL